MHAFMSYCINDYVTIMLFKLCMLWMIQLQLCYFVTIGICDNSCDNFRTYHILLCMLVCDIVSTIMLCMLLFDNVLSLVFTCHLSENLMK